MASGEVKLQSTMQAGFNIGELSTVAARGFGLLNAVRCCSQHLRWSGSALQAICFGPKWVL